MNKDLVLKKGDIVEYKQYMIQNDFPIDTYLLARIENEEEIKDLKELCRKNKIKITGILRKEKFEENVERVGK